MSTPVDIPQNINIHMPHAEKVVAIPHADSAHNSAQQSSLELANRETENKRPETKREKKENRQFHDHYDKDHENNPDSGPSEPEKVQPVVEHKTTDNLKDLNIGINVDFSV